jgi:hypothetical protein
VSREVDPKRRNRGDQGNKLKGMKRSSKGQMTRLEAQRLDVDVDVDVDADVDVEAHPALLPVDAARRVLLMRIGCFIWGK